MNKKVYVNARFLTQPITGVQRYGIELSLQLQKQLPTKPVFVAPHNILHHDIARQLNVVVVGKHTGHLWEQYDLPMYLQNEGNPLLLNLANTAPLWYRNKISTIHDVAFLVYPQTYSKSFLWFYKFLIPGVIKSSRYLITVSRFSQKELQNFYGIDSERISVIYNAVSDKFTAQDGEQRGKFFLAVSSLNHRKNFLLTLQAFDLFSKQNPDFQLRVIGDLHTDSFGQVDVQRYVQHPQIRFLGRVSDHELIQQYQTAFAFVYPSLYEGFGIPPLEAQKCGCPTIVSDIEVFREVFADSACYCNAHSAEHLAQQMQNIVQNSQYRQQMVEQGFKTSSTYSWHESALKLSKIIQSIAS